MFTAPEKKQPSSLAPWLAIALPFAVLLALTACSKLCQPPPSTPFTTFNEVQWRLVETTDPGQLFQNLSNTTFIIMTFKRDYTGEVLKVVNNKQYDTPVLTFKYNVDQPNGLLRVGYTSTDSSGGGTGGSTQAGGTGSGTATSPVTEYSYTLGRDFQLTDSSTGYTYRFVQFNGIVDTDTNCTF